MEQNFDILAQSRANYYTKGSPVQFVRVELLKGDVTGEIAVCLSFKNIGTKPLAGLLIGFKCKDMQGKVVCEDQFRYESLTAGQGDLFGSDDAVYLSPSPIGSVEVDLLQALYTDGSRASLREYKRVRLPAPKVLPTNLATQLEQRTGKHGFSVVPQMLPEGWFCACGAFHPTEEDTAWCSECGSDRILLQNTLSGLLQGRSQAAPEKQEEPTRMVDPVRPQEPTRVMKPAQEAADDEDMKIVSRPSADRTQTQHQPPRYDPNDDTATSYFEEPGEAYADYDVDGEGYDDGYDEYDGYEEEGEEDRGDYIAGQIIRWAPPITAVICVMIALGGLAVYLLR